MVELEVDDELLESEELLLPFESELEELDESDLVDDSDELLELDADFEDEEEPRLSFL